MEPKYSDPSLADICAMDSLLAQGVVAGRDVARVFMRLATLLRSDLSVETRAVNEDADSLPAGSHFADDTFHIPLASGLALRGVPRSAKLTRSILEAARLLSPSVSWCLSTPMAERAIAAPRDEPIAEALKRLGAIVTLNAKGDILDVSSLAAEQLGLAYTGRRREQLESALLAAAQAFVRHERNQQRVAPTLVMSFAYLSSREGRLIGALHRLGSDPGSYANAPVAPLLTGVELAVVSHLLSGQNELAVGERLSISAETVKTHRRHICRKLGVSSRVELSRLFPTRG